LIQPKIKVVLMTLLVKPPVTLLETIVVTTVVMPHETASFEQLKTEKVLVSHPHLLVAKPHSIAERETILSKEALVMTLSKNALTVKRT
jgi:hypothetical protein